MPEIVFLDPLAVVPDDPFEAPSVTLADTGLVSLAPKYSGVVVNQNVRPDSTNDSWEFDNNFVIQEFFLPDGYRRGTETSEILYPSISGFQIMVECLANPNVAEVEWFLEYQSFGAGWTRVASGTAIGVATNGPRLWFNIFLANPFEITSDNVDNRMRFGIHSVKNITRWWYSAPNPLNLPSRVKAYAQNGTTPLLRPTDSSEFSFCFRVLGLTADEGTDFLGNPYRSAVTQTDPTKISTASGADPNSYWLSKPNPSKFAVENLYFDLRKSNALPVYGLENWIANPNGSAESTTGWVKFSSSGTTTMTAFDDATAVSGHSIRVAATGVTTAGHLVAAIQDERSSTNAANMVQEGDRVLFSGRLMVESATGPVSSLAVMRRAFSPPDGGPAQTAIGTAINTPIIGQWYSFSQVVTVPANVSYYDLDGRITVGGAGSFTIRMERFQITPLGDAADPGYFDGDSVNCIWSGTPHLSRSFQVGQSAIDDIASTIDRVLIDPITPGAYFSIYYSNEGNPGSTEAEWENKLWIRVPQTYRMERKETHVLPEPVKAKYVKVEFSHLQARHYAPGDFQQPIRYKKHPKWVLDYFLAAATANLQNPFLAERIAVVYDALDLAYNYYLDDLGQEPESTIDVDNTQVDTVTNFLTNRTDASDKIDPQTLDKINLVLDPYRQHPALRGFSDNLLSDYARQTIDFNADYSTEESAPDPILNSAVSTLNRDRVVLEQNYPVMFFFLTCRHAYREVEAKFTHDRAYFCGVRELAFLRDNYMSAFDTSTYIESNADSLNSERNEFLS